MSNHSVLVTPRRRGGQPGNTNARRHGRYARNLGLELPATMNEAQMRSLCREADGRDGPCSCPSAPSNLIQRIPCMDGKTKNL